jgi:hypothetical protein
MASLSDERFRHLIGQFLEAAKSFPTFHFVAICEICNPEWPEVVKGEDRYVGLELFKDVWKRVLRKPTHEHLIYETVWLWARDRLWQGAYFDDDSPWENLHEQLRQFDQAKALFERLADEAAGHFAPLPLDDAGSPFPGDNKPAHRWLARLCAMPFVEQEERHFDVFRLVLNVHGSLFTASALTVEALAREQPEPSEEAPRDPGTPIFNAGSWKWPSKRPANAFRRLLGSP